MQKKKIFFYKNLSTKAKSKNFLMQCMEIVPNGIALISEK